MKIRRRTNWLLSVFGIVAIAVSLVTLLTTVVHASCSATVRCGLSEEYLNCNCTGAGVCVTGSNFVQCACNGEPPQAKKVCDAIDP